MTSGRTAWRAVQAITAMFISLVLFAGVVHLCNGDPGQAFENTLVASGFGAALLLGRFVERRVDHLQRAQGLRDRFDADVAAERAEVERWHQEQRWREDRQGYYEMLMDKLAIEQTEATSRVEAYGYIAPVREDARWVSVTNPEVVEYDPTTGELGITG